MHHISGLLRRVSTISGNVPVCQEPPKTLPARPLMQATVESRRTRPQPERALRTRSVPAPSP